MRIVHLRCELLENPLGIDVRRPRFSWTLESDRRGERQTAYQVLAARTSETLSRDVGDLWDCGKVESAETAHVEYAGAPLGSRDRCWWKVRAWDRDGLSTPWSDPGFWTMGLLDRSDWQARWIGGHPPSNAPYQAVFDPKDASRGWFGGEGASRAPMLHREFMLAAPIRRATAYVTARGLYELRLNGRRVGDHVLAPEWTDYRYRIQYQTYDVTPFLVKGPNTATALLGPGWYAGRLPTALRPYGQVPQLLMQLEVELADGSVQRIATDSAWRFTDNGPVRSACIFDGETQDATREPSGWQPVRVEPDLGRAEIRAQMHPPIRVARELRAAKVTEAGRGTYVCDLGQNIAGWARIAVKAKPGTVLKVRHDEALLQDGAFDPRDIKFAAQTETYVLRGGQTETLEPHFAYHGFRYIEISGFSEPPAHLDVVGCCMHSDCRGASIFESSHPLLNRLMSNVVWGLRSNLIGMLTDCPQRYERLGWLGDGQSFVQTMAYHLDVSALLAKWLRDMRDGQHPEGPFPDWAPAVADMSPPYAETFHGAPAWGDGGVVIPWCAYLNYADRRMLETHYGAARQHVDWIHRNNPELLWLNRRGKNWGDWCALEPMDKDAFSTAWFAHAADLLSRMATALERDEDAHRYRALFEGIRAAFHQAYVKADGRVANDTQSAYALALHFDLLDEPLRRRAFDHLVEAVHRDGGHLSTGFHTTARMLMALSRGGAHELAGRVLLTPTYPSPAHMAASGATTFWERWNEAGAHTAERKCSSLNHPCFGQVGEWVWRCLVGLEPDEQRPGYSHFMVRPRPIAGVNWVRSIYPSLRGPIAVAWTHDADHFTLDVSVPANTTATVHVPGGGPESASEGAAPFLRTESGAAVFAVEAGRHRFAAVKRSANVLKAGPVNPQ